MDSLICSFFLKKVVVLIQATASGFNIWILFLADIYSSLYTPVQMLTP